MKAIRLYLVLSIWLLTMLAVNAQQQMHVKMKNGQVTDIPVADIECITWDDKEEAPGGNPTLFTVSSTGKQVQFTKGNLYWDGNNFHLETNQTDYCTSRVMDSSHMDHFYWTTEASNSYLEDYSVSSKSTTDVPFFGESKGGLSVDGLNGLFALTEDEWNYLFEKRNDAERLWKTGVTVGGKKNCLVIAPDGFIGTLSSYYTQDEVNTLGIVCLPSAGMREGPDMDSFEYCGYYWTSTPDPQSAKAAIGITFGQSISVDGSSRNRGRSVRLVWEVK